MMLRFLFTLALVLCPLATSPALAFRGGAPAPVVSSYVGPCDAVSGGCGEAYDVAYAATSNYSGPLFQLTLLASPTSTYDVGQTSSHTANVAGALAFCGGSGTMSPLTIMQHTVSISSTCLITKIYGQIHGHANDLVYYPNRGAGVCDTAPSPTCAVYYAVESATGLPILWTLTWVGGPQYTLAGDASAVGVNGGQNPTSIVYNGAPLLNKTTDPAYSALSCCGVFGIDHPCCTDLLGTDFAIILGYGWMNAGGVGVNTNCTTTTSYCVAIDEEAPQQNADSADYAVSGGSEVIIPNITNALAAVVWTPLPSRVVSGYINGVNLFNHSPPNGDQPSGLGCSPCLLNPGTSVHFGGGGDLSQPDPFISREMLILNVALTTATYQTLFANIQARFPSLAFTSP
jgi:hypothetical protein